MSNIRTCNRTLIKGFLANNLGEEERLDFLFHLDNCVTCWEEVYNATKATHPHYYKNSSRKVKVSKRDLGDFEDSEKVSEVA